MNSDLAERARSLLDEFGKTWTLTLEDLNRPESDEVLKALIQKSPESMRERLHSEFFEHGPLTGLLELDGLQEILINGFDQIWFEREGRLARWPDRFLTAVTFKNFIDRLCTEAKIKVDLAQPFANGRWRDFRVHLAAHPVTNCDFHLSLRKSSPRLWTLERLEDIGWADGAAMRVLRELIEQRRNFLILGPTGSGKTSVLGAILKSLPENERLVILEDTDELPIANAASTKLLTRPADASGLPEIGLNDLVRQSLRMRPGRLIMGEVRGAEAKDLLLALATGHDGSLGTLHASDPRQALIRLEMLVQMGAPQWSLQAIRQLLLLSVNALVACGNKNGHRRLEGVYKVAALESFGLLIESLI
jgi:pilus assembly protein CpaF